MAISKVIYGGRTLIDLTSDTVTADQLLSGVTAHDKAGELVEGTCTFDSDTQDATVAEAEILKGKTAYARGAKITGTMPNNGSIKKTITSKDQSVVVPQGYHDGSGSVAIDTVEKSKLIPANIREGITLLGIEGTMLGTEDARPQAKTVTPGTEEQTILPDAPDYNYLSQVVVAAIPYVENPNSAGGITVTIAG